MNTNRNILSEVSFYFPVHPAQVLFVILFVFLGVCLFGCLFVMVFDCLYICLFVIDKTMVGKKPGFPNKNQPSGFLFWFFGLF